MSTSAATISGMRLASSRPTTALFTRSYESTPGIVLTRSSWVGSSASNATVTEFQSRATSSRGEPGRERVPVVHHHDVIGEPFGLEQEVGAHEHGAAVVRHLADEREHRAGRLGVEAGGRLVEQEQVGFVERRAGEREARLHAGRVAADALPERVDDREAGRRGVDRAVDVVDVPEERGVAQVLVSREPVVERGPGGHDATAAAHRFAVGHRIDTEDAQARRRRPAWPR